MPTDGGDCEQVLYEFGRAGFDLEELAAQLGAPERERLLGANVREAYRLDV